MTTQKTHGATVPSTPAPAVLLPYQRRWVADQSQVRVCEKSRRVGLSWAMACEAVISAASQKGMDFWYVGYNKEMAQEFIRDCADWANQIQKVAVRVEEELVNDGEKDILQYTIRFASGFRISALSSRPSNLRGKQGHVVIDEAAFHERLGELLKAALALLMWGGRVSVISTHDGAENPFNELVNDVKAKKLPYSLHRITLDDALNDGLYRRICLSQKKDWTQPAEDKWRDDLVAFYGDGANEELFCIPRNSGGAYLPRPLVESRMYDAPVLRLALEDGFAQRSEEDRWRVVQDWCEVNLKPHLEALPFLPHSFGEDFGRTLDLTVLVPLTLEQRLVRRAPFIVELRNVPFKQQEQVVFFIIDRLPRFIAAKFDATGNGAYLAEVTAQRYGETRIEQVKISEQWYADNLPPLKAAFEDGSIFVPKDVDILDDLRSFQVIKGIPKLPQVRNGRGTARRHGDAGVAIAMAYAASKTEEEEYEFIPVRADARNRDAFDDVAEDLEDEPTVGGGFGWRNMRGGAL